ncbi:histidine phosphatase family protein [Fluoribacter dumoffii]|uniref:Histidine phosphatase superfamily (Branch 2) n=1 Tax=Fluoribacter dumoffii TaxID=463 RepID=A0A377G860_9GAMM|nr:histidine phosphatase family protein [Fluoribacter dumoffii]KTC89875.1 major acid phosphatase Map (histidine-acid phosphatase) [Fluoribacter dumoffii NY 23]MCW8385172.1 histidine phosphatase family protein [Fluoribacter dumoffii]MCW8418226.1 histidine phosphatase family protein [Fluoribacter dumoffii]MCW8453932.1 histidine phosphatase family protein [Fluoribacter dumoffii]MCW8461997.1 histidine phosphatase family protein [Fluoribacter dumoffii]
MGYRFRLGCALLFSVPSLLFADDTLVFAVDIIRHGDRTPIVPLPAVNYQWREGQGQLTAEGMRQEYNLGKEFRKRYMEQAHLLSEHYEQGTMYVRSTDYERTLMSAESLLMGLYPPGTGPDTSELSEPALPYAFQPVPVFSAPSKYDEVIIQQVSPAERAKLMDQYVYSTKEWQHKDAALKDKYPLWSALTGIQIRGLSDLGMLGDALYIHRIHNAPMPIGLSNQDIETIIQASNWAFMAQEKPKQVAIAYSSKLMTNIANYLKEGSQKKSKLKYVLLSAHDTTIASALSFLGAPLEIAPPYASNLNFSLYEHDASSYLVKVTYNGQPVSIPECGGTACALQQFINLVNRAKINFN